MKLSSVLLTLLPAACVMAQDKLLEKCFKDFVDCSKDAAPPPNGPSFLSQTPVHAYDCCANCAEDCLVAWLNGPIAYAACVALCCEAGCRK
jgi:hypothetical protein